MLLMIVYGGVYADLDMSIEGPDASPIPPHEAALPSLSQQEPSRDSRTSTGLGRASIVWEPLFAQNVSGFNVSCYPKCLVTDGRVVLLSLIAASHPGWPSVLAPCS